MTCSKTLKNIAVIGRIYSFIYLFFFCLYEGLIGSLRSTADKQLALLPLVTAALFIAEAHAYHGCRAISEMFCLYLCVSVTMNVCVVSLLLMSR